jgi:hypothetical protein
MDCQLDKLYCLFYTAVGLHSSRSTPLIWIKYCWVGGDSQRTGAVDVNLRDHK